jgi:hypothetical protein
MNERDQSWRRGAAAPIPVSSPDQIPAGFFAIMP